MTEENSNEQSYLGPNRRDFVKAVGAAGAIGGLGASSVVSAQQDGGGQQGETALAFAYDFYPGVEFMVDASLQESVTVDILNGPDDDGIPEIDNPSDYNGYVIHYDVGDTPTYSFAFSTGQLQTDSMYMFSQDQASYFSTDLNLIESSAESGGGGNGGATGGGNGGNGGATGGGNETDGGMNGGGGGGATGGNESGGGAN